MGREVVRGVVVLGALGLLVALGVLLLVVWRPGGAPSPAAVPASPTVEGGLMPSPTAAPAATATPAPTLTPTPTPQPRIERGNVERLASVARLGKGRVGEIVFSPDGRWLAVGSSLGVYLYDVGTLEEVRWLETRALVWSVAFSPDGRLLASGSSDGTVILWGVR
ncbi:WD40 repeat domain-containing protein [Thermoflexus hugenholtzii]